MNAKEKIECLCGDYIASLVKPLGSAVGESEEGSEEEEEEIDVSVKETRILFKMDGFSAKKTASQILSIAALVIELLDSKYIEVNLL
jgi:hypothetical protein